MGWSFGWSSKQDLIGHLESGNFYSDGYKALKHSLIGNKHWTLLERPDGTVTIAIELISCHSNEWGYKGLSEDMGPTDVNCPIGFLKLASEPQSDYAKEWRERGYKFRQAKKDRPGYKTGQVWKICGKEYRLTRKAGNRKGWLGIQVQTGDEYRIPFCHLSKACIVTQ